MKNNNTQPEPKLGIPEISSFLPNLSRNSIHKKSD